MSLSFSDNLSITGIIGSRLVGTDPYDPRAWSGISPFFFHATQNCGLLRRAFGADVSKLDQALYLAKNFHPKKSTWRQHYYLDPGYRRALTKAVSHQLQPDDFGGGFLQFGAMFDTPSLLAGRTWCTSYHDGNLALRLRSPFGAAGIGQRRIKQALKYEQDVYNGLDHIFTMSEYLRQSFIDDFSIPADKVTCIGAGVNLETIPELPEGKDYAKKKILFIGIEFKRKGGHVLLEAFAKVRDTHPTAELHIVGPVPSTIPEAHQPGVVLHGFLNKQNPEDSQILQKLLTSSTLFCLPSLYEPFGIAPAEAMLHGIPAIVSGDWALGETVEDGITGWHVVPESVDSLTETLEAALSDEQARTERGQRAAKSARERFLWPSVINRLGKRLNETVARTSA